MPVLTLSNTVPVSPTSPFLPASLPFLPDGGEGIPEAQRSPPRSGAYCPRMCSLSRGGGCVLPGSCPCAEGTHDDLRLCRAECARLGAPPRWGRPGLQPRLRRLPVGRNVRPEHKQEAEAAGLCRLCTRLTPAPQRAVPGRSLGAKSASGSAEALGLGDGRLCAQI